MSEIWNNDDQDRANAQGWGLYAIDGNEDRLEIQKCDESDRFASDEEARAFVQAKASKDLFCLMAVQLTQPQEHSSLGEKGGVQHGSSS